MLAIADIDLSRLRRTFQPRRFRFDPTIDKRLQRGNEWYRNDPFDRGHLVRRRSIRWGNDNEAAAAERESDYYTNIVPHHTAFHDDEWRAVEHAVLRIVRERAAGMRAIIVSGVWYDDRRPQFDSDRTNERRRRVPNAYWKTVVYVPRGSGRFRVKKLVFWVPHDRRTTTSRRDMELFGIDTRQFVIGAKELRSRIAVDFDANWTIKDR